MIKKILGENERENTHLEANSGWDVLIEHTESHHRKGSEGDIVERYVPVIVSRLCWEESMSLEPEEGKAKCEVLVEKVTYLFRK